MGFAPSSLPFLLPQKEQRIGLNEEEEEREAPYKSSVK